MSQLDAETRAPVTDLRDVTIVDADVHTNPRSAGELRGHLAPEWRDMPDAVLFPTPGQLYAPQQDPPYRGDSLPANGPAGSDPDLVDEQLLVEAGIDHAMLISPIKTFQNRDIEAAICAATNSWLEDTWLTAYNSAGSYWGSISVCMDEPRLACREMERWAGHPRMKQVKINSYTAAPLGDPRYHTVYALAERLGLPIGVHFAKGSGASLLTPAGFMRSYVELHALFPLNYGAHLVSLVFNGVFERFPGLRYVFIEGGFGWVGPLLWRMDRHWESGAAELPAVKRPPSEYVLEHVRFTSQPLEEPADKQHLTQCLEWAQADRLLMFATDYPHWDYDDPQFVIRRIPRAIRDRVLRDNALELYGLPAKRPARPHERTRLPAP